MKFSIDTQGFSVKNKVGNQYILRYKNFYTSDETYIPKSFKSKYPDRYLNILRKARKYFKDTKTRYFIINQAIQQEKKKLGIKTKKTKEPKEEPKKDELKQYTTHIGLWKVAEKEKKRKGQIILMRELSYTIHLLLIMKKTLLFYDELGIKGNLTIERRMYCTKSSNDCHYDVKNDMDICECDDDFEFVLKFVSSSDTQKTI
eukprot:gene12768-7042_t